MGYNFTACWTKGTKNEAADALSRHPHHAPVEGDDDLAEYDIDLQRSKEHGTLAVSVMEIRQLTAEPEDLKNLHLQELRQRVETDREYQDLKCVIQNGFPDQKGSMPDHLKKYWGVRDTISVDDDLIVHGCRLLIPLSLRPTILSRLHEAHQGVSRSQARARLTIYWPGIDLDIENFVKGCKHCQDHLPSNVKEPMVAKQLPDRPFQQIAADFAYHGGKEFLIVVDCKTDWPDIVEFGRDCSD